MNILIIHEVDWIKKVTYEMHHLSELFSLAGHNVFAIDIPDPGRISLSTGSRKVQNYNRVYKESSVTLLRTPIIPIRGIHRITAYLTSYSFIKRALKEYEIEVVMMYSVLTNAKAAIKACKELRIPILHRTFDIPHDLIRENYLRKRALKIERMVYPHFDKVITNTKFMQNWAVEMGATNVAVISQGVDPSIMKPLPVNTELQKKLRLNNSFKVVMYLGTIEAFSGLDHLIERIPEILKAIPEFRLLVVGGGSYLEYLKQIAEKLQIIDKVIFMGYRPYAEIPLFCSLASLCINTFRVNDMTNRLSPVKAFDLQACGKPVLATPLQGLLTDFPEKDSGMIYCQLEDFDECIIELLRNEKWLEQKGMQGKEFVKDFTWSKLAEMWIKELEQLRDIARHY